MSSSRKRLRVSTAQDWRARAACLNTDPELFFPVGNTGTAVQQIEEAKAVCRDCSVSFECLKFAMDTNQDYGVWGCMSEDDRRRFRQHINNKKRKAAAAGMRV